MSLRIGNPFPYWLDRRGFPLDGGSLYVGAVGQDPELSPITVYLDAALTEVAPQPIAIIGGVLCHDGNARQFHIGATEYSIRARDRSGAEVLYDSEARVEPDAWQPLDDDLTAIAALTTTAFGRAFLSLTNQAAARAYIGVAEPTNPTESFVLMASDETTAIVAGVKKITFPMPYAFTVTSVKANLVVPQVSGSIFTVDINENGSSILSAKLTIDNGEKTSATAVDAAILSDVTIAADSEITIDVDQVGDGTAKGLKVTLIGKRP